MQEIKPDYTIVIVTHNMQQAARVSDRTAFFTTEVNPESDRRTGVLVEFDPTDKIFSNPTTSGPRSTSPAGSADVATSRRTSVSQRAPTAFHHELEASSLGAGCRRVTELIPRATDILLDQDLEGAEYDHPRRRRDRRQVDRRGRGEVLSRARAPVAGRRRPPPGRLGAEADRRDRALGRPLRQHLQGGPPHLRPRSRPRSCAASSRRWATRRQLYKEAIEAYLAVDACGPRRSTTWTRSSTTCSASSSRP